MRSNISIMMLKSLNWTSVHWGRSSGQNHVISHAKEFLKSLLKKSYFHNCFYLNALWVSNIIQPHKFVFDMSCLKIAEITKSLTTLPHLMMKTLHTLWLWVEIILKSYFFSAQHVHGCWQRCHSTRLWWCKVRYQRNGMVSKNSDEFLVLLLSDLFSELVKKKWPYFPPWYLKRVWK